MFNPEEIYNPEENRQIREQNRQRLLELEQFEQQMAARQQQVRSLQQQAQTLTEEQRRTEELRERALQSNRALAEVQREYINRLESTIPPIPPELAASLVQYAASQQPTQGAQNVVSGTTPRVIATASPGTTPRVTENIVPQTSDTLFRESYETLIKQLYGLAVQLPEFLIINGIRANFVPFQVIGTMLQNNQIERYIIDPLLQPWAGSPGTEYRIFTFFGKNGVTYLVKARYNSQTNEILP